jgi:transmembrane sensor
MTTSVPREVTRQAASWVVQLRSADRSAGTDCEFADWLRASPVHVAEYLLAVEVWQALAHVDLDRSTSSESLIDEARRFGATALPITPAPVTSRPARGRWLSSRTALGAIVAVLGTFTWMSWERPAVIDLATGIGEQRSAVLPDRSIVELNTRSEIRVIYSASQRRIELVRGEAFFQVAKNPARPFVVFTDLATATAVGTRFSVYRASRGTIVTVEEGRVLVSDIRPTTRPGEQTRLIQSVEVDPGTQAEAQPSRPVQTHRADLQRSLAWRERRLVFDGTPLAQVIEEFNRYNSVTLLLMDTRLSDRRISGVFDANDPESLIDFLVKVDRIPVNRSDQRAIRIGEGGP